MSFFRYSSTREHFKKPTLDIQDEKVITVPLDYQFKDGNGNSALTGNQNIVVDWEMDGDNWCSLAESYFRFTVKLSAGLTVESPYTYTVGVAGEAPLAFAYNAGSGFFSKVAHYVNNVLVDECNTPMQTEAFYWRTKSRSYRKKTMEGQFLADYAKRLEITRGLGASGALALAASPATINGFNCANFVDAAAAGFVWNSTRTTNELIWTPVCLSSFRSKTLFPPNCKHRLVMTVNPMWQFDCVEYDKPTVAGSLVPSLDPLCGYTTLLANGAATRNFNNYFFNLNGLEFNYQTYSGEGAPSNQVFIPLRPIKSQYKLLTSAVNQAINYQIDPSTHRITFFLQNRNQLYNRATYSKSNFKSNTVADRTAVASDTHLALQGFYFKCGDRMYPNPPAKLYLEGDDRHEVSKIYKDTLVSLLKDEDNLSENVNDWSADAFYTYILPNCDSNELRLFLTFGENPSEMACWVMHEYQKVLSLEYADGELQNVSIE